MFQRYGKAFITKLYTKYTMPNFQTTRTLKKLKQTSSDNILLNKKGAEKKNYVPKLKLGFLAIFHFSLFCQWNQKHSFFLRMLNSYMSNKILDNIYIYIYIYKCNHIRDLENFTWLIE